MGTRDGGTEETQTFLETLRKAKTQGDKYPSFSPPSPSGHLLIPPFGQQGIMGYIFPQNMEETGVGNASENILDKCLT